MKWVQDSPGKYKFVEDGDPRPTAKIKRRTSYKTGIILGKGTRTETIFYEPDGTRHIISDAHLKDIKSRKLNPDGSVSRRGVKSG